ncbi:MAG TPA: pitrilysin family protein [Patescibacteria group bacterium]|nr:pitrilysin family protein [Patescibacteria group bacterium]
MIEFETRYDSLSNGVRRLEIPIPHDETAVCAVFVKAGSRNEITRREAGISHAIEHKVYRGTTMRSGNDYALAVDRLGSDSNAYTDREHTMFHIDVEAKYAQKSLELLSEVLVKPDFPRRAMKKENGVLVGEMADNNDNPYVLLSETFENMLYGKNSMSKPILGTKDSVRAHTKRDLTRYMDKWYRGENVLVVLAGKIKRMGNLVEKYFGSLPPGPVTEPLDKVGYGKERQRILTIDSGQAHFILGVPGISMKDPNFYTFQIMESVLGSMESSRLYSKVRSSKGLVYDISTSNEVGTEVGYLSIEGSVQPQLLAKTLKTVKTEIFNLSKTITREEVIRAKTFLRGNLLRRMRNTLKIAEMLGIPALFLNIVEQPKQILEKIDRVTLSDVRNLAKTLLVPEEMRLAILGPFDENLKRVREFN